MKILQKDLDNKLTNGILTPLVLFLISFFMALLIPVIEVLFGRPGLLIYAIVLISVSAILLERSIVEKFSETIQGRFGMAGGMVGWIVIEIAERISQTNISSETGVIAYLLVFLVVFIFWLKLFPIGAKFFFSVFLSLWSGHLFLDVIRFLSIGNPYALLIRQITVFSALGVTLISVIWILIRSKTPVQRLWAALVLGLSLAAIAYALQVFLPTFYL